jgi:hypothetical protein
VLETCGDNLKATLVLVCRYDGCKHLGTFAAKTSFLVPEPRIELGLSSLHEAVIPHSLRLAFQLFILPQETYELLCTVPDSN